MKQNALFFLVLFFSTVLTAQTENRLIHPTLFDHFMDYQILPSNGIRVFTISDQNNGWINREFVYQDLFFDKSLDTLAPVEIYIPGEGFYDLIDKADILKFSDGSVLLVNDFFDCDYGGKGGLIKLEANGDINWFLDFRDLDIGPGTGEASNLVFVDSNHVYIGVTVDLEGNITDSITPAFLYDHTLQTFLGFLAASTNQLQLLDGSFQVYQSYFLDGDVERILPVNSDDYIIQTQESYYLLENESELFILPISPIEFSSVWKSDSYYWGVKDKVIKWDTSFNLIDTLELPNGVTSLMGVSKDDDIICCGQYNTDLSEGIICYKGTEENMDFNLSQDIGITDIQISDSVVIEKLNLGHTGTIWNYHYKQINVDITNFGLDTIFKFVIQGHDVSKCYAWCTYSWPVWEIDSVAVAPGATCTIRLDSFDVNCVKEEHNSLCLSSMAPNYKGDGNFSNDKNCESFSVILAVPDSEIFSSINLKPNPANEYIFLEVREVEILKGQIFNSTGVLCDQLDLSSNPKVIDVSMYIPGFYIIRLTDRFGHIFIEKFNVVR